MAKGNSLHLSSRSIFSHYYSSIFEIFSSHYEQFPYHFSREWLVDGRIYACSHDNMYERGIRTCR